MTAIKTWMTVRTPAAAVLATAAAAGTPPGDLSYELSTSCDVHLTIGDQEQVVDAQTRLGYTLRRDEGVTTLLFDVIEARSSQGGTVLVDSSLSGEGVRELQGGQMREIPAATSPAPLRAVLRDTFGSPICRFTFDEDGREVSRIDVAGPGARRFVENGHVVNARLFHVAWPDGSRWDADNEFALGAGQVVRGTLTYVRGVTDPDGRVTVTVSGTLANEAYAQGVVTIANTVYAVTGAQVYDPAREAWVAGELRFDVTYELLSGGQRLGTATGTMHVRLKEAGDAPRPDRTK